MNILFIANRFPYPPYRGDKLKVFNLAKRLSKKHKLYLITFVQHRSDFKYLKELEKYFTEIRTVYLPKYISIIKCVLNIFSKKPFQVIYFQSASFGKELNDFLKKISVDVIHTQHLRMSQYSSNLNIKKILDLPDAYSLYWQRRAYLKKNFIQSLFGKIEYKKVLNYEKIINNFDLNLVCSQEDKDFLTEKHSVINIEILPNGVDLDTFKFNDHDYSISKRIIFTGNMDYFPNIDGVYYFVKEIFPLILKVLPDVKFYVVGQKPVKKILDLSSDNIIVTGFVDDLSVEYDKSAIAVSPIRFGAGTLNKVLEPMAMGIPVVSSEIGFKGLGVFSGDGVILARDREQFAESVIKLLKDENLRKEIGLKGKDVVNKRYGWDRIADLLEIYFKKIP